MTVQDLLKQFANGPAEGLGVLIEGFFGTGWKPASFQGSGQMSQPNTPIKPPVIDKRFGIDKYSRGNGTPTPVPTPTPINVVPSPKPKPGPIDFRQGQREKKGWAGL